VALHDELLAAVLDRIKDLRPAAGGFGRRDPAGHERDDIRQSDFLSEAGRSIPAETRAGQVTFPS
jgi:hypothetical protein